MLAPLHATRGDDAAIVDHHDRQILLRGVNVNQLGDYYRANPRFAPVIPLEEADFDRIAELGFNHVRLILNWSALEPSPGSFDAGYLARIRQAVAWAKARGIYTVLDMHQDAWGKYVATPPGETCLPGASPNNGWDGAPQWATHTDGQPTCAFAGVREIAPAVGQAWQSFWIDRDGIQGRLVATWARLAREFAAEPAVAGYDLLNEPNPGYTVGASGPTVLAAYYRRAIAAIRAAERSVAGGFSHVVFFEPLVVWSATGVDPVPPPGFTDDPNIVFAPHVYAGSLTVEPFVTTREGHDFAETTAQSYGTTYWSGEWGWFGDPADDRDKIAGYAHEEDARRVGGAWWSWKQACGDPHVVPEPGAEPSSLSPSLNRYACPEQRSLGIPRTTRRILARAYPRFAPGRLTALESDPETGALRVAGRDPEDPGSCRLEVWLPGDLGRPRLTGTNLSGISVRAAPGGWLARACARDSYELRRVPAGPSLSGRLGCLAQRSSVGPRGIGRVRLGYDRSRMLRRVRVLPLRRPGRRWEWCVKRSRGRLVAVFAGKARVVASSAPGHRLRRVGRGSSLRQLRRRFPRARRIGRGLYRAAPRSSRLFVIRHGRVRYVAVAERRVIARPATLRRYLRRSGL